MIGMMMPQIFSLSVSSSEGTMRAALRASANFMTMVSHVMLLRMSVRNEDLKPIVRSSPLYSQATFSYAAMANPRSCAELSSCPGLRSNLMWLDA